MPRTANAERVAGENNVQGMSTPGTRYEFALHGLLALGAGDNPQAMPSPCMTGDAREERATETRDFAAGGVTNLALQDESEAGLDDQGVDEGGSFEYDAHDDLQTEIRTGPEEIVSGHQERSEDLQVPEGETALEDISQSYVLELLKHYRYHIAPWVR